MGEQRVSGRQAERLDQVDGSIGELRGDEPDTLGVSEVDREPDRDGGAVCEGVIGEFFQAVRGPMTEVERPSDALFEGIAAASGFGFRDVLHVQFGGASPGVLSEMFVALGQNLSVLF